MAQSLQRGPTALVAELPTTCAADIGVETAGSRSERRDAVVSIRLVQNIRQVSFEAINRLKAKGYIRFGCYAPTDTTTTDQQLDKATSMFLVFKAANDDTLTSVDNALVIRPQFSGKIVKTLAISDNRAWIVATLKTRGYECNGFEVKKPPGVQ